jgi:hypothetical protein
MSKQGLDPFPVNIRRPLRFENIGDGKLSNKSRSGAG